MASFQVKKDGVVPNIKKTYVKVSGKWLPVLSVQTKTGGKWR